MSVQEAKARIPSTEFILWREYLRREYNRPRREDYYLAQIAAETGFKESRSFYRSFLKHSGITASRYRKNQLSKDFPEIFKKNVNRKKK